jgi:hypothetical protein
VNPTARSIKQPFETLPPAVRQRLANDIGAHLEAQASPVAFSIRASGGVSGLLKPLLLAALCLGGAALLAAVDFGRPGPGGVQAWLASVIYASFVGGAVALLLGIWPLHRRGVVPLAPGVYFFAWDIVDTRDGGFKVHSLRDLRQLGVTDVVNQGGRYLHTRLDFALADGSNASYAIAPRDAAQRSIEQLRARNQQLNAALQAGNGAAVAALDPFHAVRQSGAPAAVADSAAHRLVQSRWAWSVLAGLVLGQVLWLARNVLSDEAMYGFVGRTGTEAAYQSYVDHGWRHVDAARAALPRAALSDARKAGTVVGLRGVLQRYPAAGLEAEVAADIHAIFVKAFERFQRMATRSDATVEPFVQQLLQRLEASGSSVVGVSFVRPGTEALARVDNARPGMVPAARHFGSDSAAARERRMVAELAKGFRLVFPEDVLSLVAAGSAPPPQRPLLQVAYEIAPSGAVFTSSRTGRRFVGVVIDFSVVFAVPGAGTPWRTSLKVLPPDRFTVAGHSDEDDGAVYAEMADRAFDQLSARLNDAFFAPKRH